ncbi:hypothetical protein LguiA_022996 [Lonicera macranthoides]
MLHAAVPRSNFTLQRKGVLSTFTMPEYSISIMLSHNAFLVDVVEEKIGTVLKLDSIKNGDSWKGFDMLIFNTWHWWLHKGHNQPWDYLEEGGKIYKYMDRLEAFTKGLKTWSKWVDSNVDPTITKVFYQGTSPTHYNGKEWNVTKSTTCNGQTQPISGSMYPGGPMAAERVVKEVLSNMTKIVNLQDVTTLSQLRKMGTLQFMDLVAKREMIVVIGVLLVFLILGINSSMLLLLVN